MKEITETSSNEFTSMLNFQCALSKTQALITEALIGQIALRLADIILLLSYVNGIKIFFFLLLMHTRLYNASDWQPWLLVGNG